MALFGEKYGDVVRMVERRRRRLVARAVRRHARALDRRDRRLQDHPGDVERRQRAPHRGGHRPRRRSRCCAATTACSWRRRALRTAEDVAAAPQRRAPRGASARPQSRGRRSTTARPRRRSSSDGVRVLVQATEARPEGAARPRRQAARQARRDARSSCSASPGDGKVSLVASATPAAVERGVKAGALVKTAAAGRRRRRRRPRHDGAGRRPRPREAPGGARGGPRGDRRSAGLSRIVALDHGSARCGVAVSDPTGTLVTPLEPVLAPRHPQGPRARARADRRATTPSGWSSGCRCRSQRRRLRPDARGARASPTAGAGRSTFPFELHDERFTTRIAGTDRRKRLRGLARGRDPARGFHAKRTFVLKNPRARDDLYYVETASRPPAAPPNSEEAARPAAAADHRGLLRPDRRSGRALEVVRARRAAVRPRGRRRAHGAVLRQAGPARGPEPRGASRGARSWRRARRPASPAWSRVDALQAGRGGTFAMEAVFVPVKLDEGFDFSLFLEDLGFELPIDMMLLRMRQQHPVVVRALRAALEPAAAAVGGRPHRRHARRLPPARADAVDGRGDAAARGAQRRGRGRAAVAHRDARGARRPGHRRLRPRRRPRGHRPAALGDRAHRGARGALAASPTTPSQQAADARVRAEAAEKAALDAKAEISGVLRPPDRRSCREADRLELIARVERIERAATDAAEAAAAQRLAAEAERARATELEAQRAELLSARAVEHAAGRPARGAAASPRRSRRADRRSTRTRAAAAAQRRARRPPRDARADARPRGEATRAELAARAAADEDVHRAGRAQRPEEAGLSEEDRRRLGDLRARRRVRRQRATSTRCASRVAAQRGAASEERARRARPRRRTRPRQERQQLEVAAAGAAEHAPASRRSAPRRGAAPRAAELREEGGALRDQVAAASSPSSRDRLDDAAPRRSRSWSAPARGAARRARRAAPSCARPCARPRRRAPLAERGPPPTVSAPAPSSTTCVAAARAALDELRRADRGRRGVRLGAASEAAGAAADAPHRRDPRRTPMKAAAATRGARADRQLVDRDTRHAIAQVSHQRDHRRGRRAGRAAHDAAQAPHRRARRVARGRDAPRRAARLEELAAATARDDEARRRSPRPRAGARREARERTDAVAATAEVAAGAGSTSGARDAARPRPAEASSRSPRRPSRRLDELRGDVNDRCHRAAANAPRRRPRRSVGAPRGRLDEVKTAAPAMERAEGARRCAVQALTRARRGRGAPPRAPPRGGAAGARRLADAPALESVGTDLAAARTRGGAAAGDDASRRLRPRRSPVRASSAPRRGRRARAARGRRRREGQPMRQGGAPPARPAARRVEELRTEVQAALVALAEFKVGFEEARQAAVAARREAEQAKKAAAEKAGAVNEVTTREVHRGLAEDAHDGAGAQPPPQRPGAACRTLGARGSKPKEAPPAREPRGRLRRRSAAVARAGPQGQVPAAQPGLRQARRLPGARVRQGHLAVGRSTARSTRSRQAELDEMVVGERERIGRPTAPSCTARA